MEFEDKYHFDIEVIPIFLGGDSDVAPPRELVKQKIQECLDEWICSQDDLERIYVD